MSKDHQKEKVRSVFNYKYFQLAAAVPLVLGFILMIFIWKNDNLSLEWPSKKTLDTFLAYMSVPLWIMGASIPFATLAAANFRAIQFQENLEYQKRNLERQEYEHALDLYHKELTIFKEKLTSSLANEKYKFITASDSTMIFTRLYEKPTKRCMVPAKPDSQVIEHLYFSISCASKGIKAIDGLRVITDIDKRNETKTVFLKEYFPELGHGNHIIAEKLRFGDMMILQFILIYEGILKQISHALGIKLMLVNSETVLDIIKFYSEVIRFYVSIQDESKWPESSIEYNDEVKEEDINILNHWLSETTFDQSDTLNLIINRWFAIIALSEM
jgi:hypothetical protein